MDDGVALQYLVPGSGFHKKDILCLPHLLRDLCSLPVRHVLYRMKAWEGRLPIYLLVHNHGSKRH